MDTGGISIKWKLLIAFVGMVAVVVLIILYTTSSIVENRIRADINNNFAEAARIFERVQDIRFRQLRQTGILLAEIPQLKAAVSTGDTTTVNQILREELIHLLDFNPVIPESLVPDSYFEYPDSAGLLLITDDSGIPIGQMATRPLVRYSIAERPGISTALEGIYPEQLHLWKINDEYYNVTTVPIFLSNRLLGTLSYGFPIRQLEAQQLSRDIGMEISYFVDNRLLTTSFSGLTSTQMEQLSQQIHNATYEVVKTGESNSLELNLGRESWLVYVAPMQSETGALITNNGYYAVAKSLTTELQPLRSIQFMIFLLGGLAVFAAVITSFWFTTRITKPISMLVEGVQRLEHEDFSKEVPVTTNDELGRLTTVFNELTKGIQERLLILKFVSQATLDAIKNNLSQIDAGGEKRQITVFFSDIRGFTSWSEKHSPEDVIVMLNKLFSFQGEVVKKFGGDVDKFVGDELVAIFQGEDKEQRAVEAAMAIQRNIQGVIDAEEEITVGIGINTGEMIMGAMGSPDRMEYTVIGSEVNLGARLCMLAQKKQILISQAVCLCLERKTHVREMDAMEIKGISKPVTIFEVEWQYEAESETAVQPSQS